MTTCRLFRQFIILALALPIGFGYSQENTFQQGMAAFKKGQYQRALAYFQQAQNTGNHSPALHYNLAVCNYRLARYEDARQGFETLINDPRWGGIARYNLGLIAEATGEPRQAQRWYADVASATENAKLRALADQKLAMLTGRVVAAGQAPAKDWLALFNVGAAYDSNAASLADELTQTSSNAKDTYQDYMGYLQKYVAGRKGRGVKVYGLAYVRDYNDYSAYDSAVYGIGGTGEAPVGEFVGEMGLMLTRAEIGSRHLTDQTRLQFGLSRLVGGDKWFMEYLPSYFNAAERYAQVEGWQHRFEVGWQSVPSNLVWKARYRLELNNREDLIREDSFYSYSPTRNSLIGDVKWKPTAGWDVEARLEYRHSDYDDPNRLTDIDGQFKQQERRNRQWKYSVGVTHRFTLNWSLTGQYKYVDTNDNFNLYVYDKQELGLSLQYLY